MKAITLLLLIAFVDARTAYVSQEGGPGLVESLSDPTVSTIVLNGSYRLPGLEGAHPDSPIPLNRNVTITAQHGTQDVLDLRFQRSLFLLGPSVTVTFANITVVNERRGNGNAWDAFVGQPGSIVAGVNIIRKRLACTPAADTALVISRAPRSPLLPPTTTPAGDDEWTIINTTFQGRDYPASLFVFDYGPLVPAIVQEGHGASGGYVSWSQNVTRLCDATTARACLQAKSADACVNELIDAALAPASSPVGGLDGPSAGILAAIIIPSIVLLGALLCGLMVLLLLRRRRRRQLLEPEKAPQPACSDGSGISRGADLERGSGRSGPGALGSRNFSVSEDGGLMRAPLADGARGWQVTSSLTSPLLGALGDEAIHFGKLLGAGSFGRVYRARWAGRDVAVKVIEHDLAALKAVENEVALMMAFNHPNVVRALHCVTHVQEPDATSGSIASDRLPYLQLQPSGASGQELEPSLQQLLQQQDLPIPSGIAAGPPGSQQQQQQQQQQTPGPSTAAAAGDTTQGTQSSDCARGSTSSSFTGEASDVGRKTSATTASQRMLGVRAETWLVQEFCDLGTLANIAQEWLPDDDDEQMLERLLLLQDCALGMQCLHAKSVVHGDLNARNVLVSSSPTAQFGMVAKLADLGLSRTIRQHKTHRTTQSIGTVSHMPPELLQSGRMSPAVDIYAFGVMMWELFTGDLAFAHLHYGGFFHAIVLQGQRPPIPASMPPDYASLMTSCWAADQADRPTVQRLLDSLASLAHERKRSLWAAERPGSFDTGPRSAPLPALPLQPGQTAVPQWPNTAPSTNHTSDVSGSARSSMEPRACPEDNGLLPSASGGSFGRAPVAAAAGGGGSSFTRRHQRLACVQQPQAPKQAQESAAAAERLQADGGAAASGSAGASSSAFGAQPLVGQNL